MLKAGNLNLLHAACLLPPTTDLLEVVNMLLIKGADPNNSSTVSKIYNFFNVTKYS